MSITTVLRNLVFALFLIEAAHCFEVPSAQSPASPRGSVCLGMAWSASSAPATWAARQSSGLRAFGKWYEEIDDPIHRSGSYEHDEFEESFSLHSPAYDWPSSEGKDEVLKGKGNPAMASEEGPTGGWALGNMSRRFAKSFI